MEADSSVRPSQRESRWLIAIVFASIALRIVLLLVRGGDLQTDPDAYVAHAKTLQNTGSFCVPGTERPTAFRPPVYPSLLAILGFLGMKLTTAATIINLASTAILVISTWWIARVLKLRGIWPPVCAAAIGFDPLLLRYSVLPMTEVVSAALLSVAILQVLKLRYEVDETTPRKVAIQSAVAAGICFGIGGLCRPVILVVCAVLTVMMAGEYAFRRLMRQPSAHEHAELNILPALVAGLILIPWVIRNAVHFEHFIPATTHGGYTLLLANNQVFYDEVVCSSDDRVWQGDSLEEWQRQLKRDAKAAGIDMSNEVSVDQWMYQQAAKQISENPTAFMKSIWLRWKRFGALQPSHQAEPSRFVRWGVGGFYFFVWLGLLACVYLWVIQRHARVQMLFLAIISFLLIHSFYWTNTRMRVPLSSAIIVLSAIGWQFLEQLVKDKFSGRSQAALETD